LLLSQQYGECALCAEGSLELIQCASENGCDYETCLDDAESISDLESGECCPACSDKFSSTLTCFKECIPECVYTTIVQYAACAELKDCEEPCKAKIQVEAESAANDVVTQAEDGSYEFDLSDVGDLGNVGGVSTEDLTCTNLEEEFSEDVCDLANCCDECIDQFEDVAECIINEVVFEQLLNQSDSNCEVECGDNPSLFGGWPPSGEGRERLLQPMPGDGALDDSNLPGNGALEGSNLPGNGAPGDGSGFSQEPFFFNLFDRCRTDMAGYFAVGQAEGAYGAYLECLLGSVARFSTSASEAGGIESPTAAPDGSSAATGFMSSLLLLQIVSALALNMLV
jgi:hypothetical protein